MKDKVFFEKYIELFLNENQKVNLISKNDEKYLWEKHIYDSLCLELFFDKYKIPETILDIGTGGGFPAVPIALAFNQIEITALDSTLKKINAIQNIKNQLNIQNLNPVWSRVENYNKKFDLVTSRAVASLDKICDYALPKTNKNGYFVAFKSKKANEEINNAKSVLKKYNSEIIDIINYELPLEQNFARCLIIIKK